MHKLKQFSLSSGYFCYRKYFHNGGLLPLLFSCLFLINCSDKKGQRLYRIYDGKSYGFIDSLGKLVISPRFKYASFFQQDLAIVADTGKWLYQSYSFVNLHGDTILNSTPYIIDPFPSNLYPYENTRRISTKNITSVLFQEYSFSDGLALIYDNRLKRFGYIDKHGQVLIEPQYVNASRFKNGYAVVQTSFDNLHLENTHTGLIDSTGKMIISDKYYQLTKMSHGLLIGTLATKNNEVNDSTYLFTSLLLNQKGQVINTIGNGISYFGDFSGGYAPGYNVALASLTGKGYFIVDSVGNILKDTRNRENLYFEDLIINQGKYFWYENNEKYFWFIINNNSITVVDKKPYENVNAGFNTEGLASVAFRESDDNEKYGYIDTFGNFFIQPRFYSGNDFRGPLAPATLKSGNIKIQGYINKKGTFVWSREVRDSFN